MHAKRYWLAVVPLFFILTCGADKSRESNPSHDLPYLHEAEEMALYYSGELRPPEDLTRRISHELSLLRYTWADSIPAVNMTYFAPWNPSSVTLKADDTAFASIMEGYNTEWNRLCARFDLTYRETLNILQSYFIHVYSPNDLLHPIRLAEYFIGFPGISYISVTGRPSHHRRSFVRHDDNSIIKYYVREICLQEIYATYYNFEIKGNGAELVGQFSECHPDLDSLIDTTPPDSFFVLEAIRDSIEQSRPAWVDTVRFHLGRHDDGDPFIWYRSE